MSQQDGEVRRFTVDAISDGGEIVLSDQRGRLYYEKDGALCLASDYDALAARLAEAERKVAVAQFDPVRLTMLYGAADAATPAYRLTILQAYEWIKERSSNTVLARRIDEKGLRDPADGVHKRGRPSP